MNPQPRFDTVLFDLDGTLCDTIELILASYAHAHRQVLDLDLDPVVARRWIGRTLGDTYAEFPGHEQALWDAYMDFNLANLEALQTDVEGIADLLDDLAAAGVRMGVVTSKKHSSAARSLAASGLTGRVPVLCAMEDTDVHKPNPEPLLFAARALDVEASTCAYVGDAVVDVRAAQAAGMGAVAVTWGAGDRTDLLLAEPDWACDSVDDLRRVLLG